MKIIKLLKKIFNISYLSIFKFGLKFRMIIAPDHFYVPIANILELKNDNSWKKKTKMNGIDFNKKTQIKNINKKGHCKY